MPSVHEAYSDFDPQFSQIIYLAKRLGQERQALFSPDLDFFANPNRMHLPVESLDDFKRCDQTFFKVLSDMQKAFFHFAECWGKREEADVFSLKRNCEQAFELVKDALQELVPLANMAIAEYFHYGLLLGEEDPGPSVEEWEHLHKEGKALSSYGATLRELQKLFQDLPELPSSMSRSDYQISVGIMAIVVVLCLTVSQLPTLLQP